MVSPSKIWHQTIDPWNTENFTFLHLVIGSARGGLFYTVDGRNPALVDKYFIFHQQYQTSPLGFNMLTCFYCISSHSPTPLPPHPPVSSSSKLPSPEEMSRSQITDSALMKKMLVASCAYLFGLSVMIIPCLRSDFQELLHSLKLT